MEKVVPVSLESQVLGFSRVINKSVPFMFSAVAILNDAGAPITTYADF